MKQVFFVLIFLLMSISRINAQCEEDCVWPGDLNANGIANNLDILAIGFSIDETGPTRANPSNDWEGFLVDDWTGNLPGLNKNFKHSDADGNGVVNDQDQLPISINYNLTNDSFAGLLGNNLIGNDLFLVPQNLIASPSGSYIIDIHLGTADNVINDIYGIGFQIEVDTGYVSSVNFDFSESWIGVNDDVLAYGKYSDEIEHIGTAITRLDGTTVSGFGKIAQLEIVITDVVLGLIVDPTECLPFFMNFQNVLGINDFEEDLLIKSRGDTLSLKDESQLTTTEALFDLQSKIKIHPNPVKDILHIQHPDIPIKSLALVNIMGQQVIKKHLPESSPAFNHTHSQIDVEQLPRGIYFLEISGAQFNVAKKIFLK